MPCVSLKSYLILNIARRVILTRRTKSSSRGTGRRSEFCNRNVSQQMVSQASTNRSTYRSTTVVRSFVVSVKGAFTRNKIVNAFERLNSLFLSHLFLRVGKKAFTHVFRKKRRDYRIKLCSSIHNFAVSSMNEKVVRPKRHNHEEEHATDN